MRRIQSFCPASISFIFKFCYNKDIYKLGSIGIGCTVDKKVGVTVRRSEDTTILLNEKKAQFPTVNYIIRSLAPEPVLVKITSSLPVACGFGISGASALACAFALNKLFNLGKNRQHLVKIAHAAEVVNKTGLGSVTTQITGGFLLKTTPGVLFRSKSLPFIGREIYCVVIDKLETPSILEDNDILRKINKAADWALDQIKGQRSITLEQIIDISYNYCKRASFLKNKKVLEIIRKIQKSGAKATMAILGQVVISNKTPQITTRYPVIKLKITADTVYIL